MLKKRVEEEIITEEEDMNQDTVSEASAADSLRADSMPEADPKSKIEMMKVAIGTMASMSSDELTKWFNDSIAQIGKEAANIPDGTDAKNKASIFAKPSAAVGGDAAAVSSMPMISVKEDLEILFNSDDSLSEEFKERTSALFEAAVTARIIFEKEQLEEQFAKELEESAEEISKDLEEKLDVYLNYVVEQWVRDNEVAIESTLRSELSEEFIEGLRGLFAEHFIQIPEEKVDVVETLTQKISDLEEEMNNLIEENNDLRQIEAEVELENAFDETTDGLSVSQIEKFKALAEGLEFDGNVDMFKRKLEIIRESYFKPAKSQDSLNEEVNHEETTEVRYTDASVRRYAQAISRINKKQ